MLVGRHENMACYIWSVSQIPQIKQHCGILLSEQDFLHLNIVLRTSSLLVIDWNSILQLWLFFLSFVPN